MFNHCVIVISLWNFECLIQRVFLYFLKTVMHMSTNIIFVCHFPGVNGSTLFKKNIYFWYGNFRYEDFNYLFQDLFEKGVVNTFI